MAEITAHSSLQEVAAIISQALVAHGVDATLSGGAAVSIYTDNRYQSHDLDFVSTVGINTLARVVNKLGFVVTPSRRLFAHPESQWLLEFPSGPLGFGNRVVDTSSLQTLETPYGPLRVIPPTLCAMDRLAAFVHWRDRQCLEQAIWVAQSHAIDWDDLRSWANQEGMSEADWQSFHSNATAQNGG
jgi:hypothetical protein